MNENQASFDGWAVVEVMGRQSYSGYVVTEAYGAAVLFRVDVPELPEREYALKQPEWIGGSTLPAGTTVKRPAEPGYTKLIGAGSIYCITPTSEELVREHLEKCRRRPLLVLDRGVVKEIANPDADPDEDYDPDNDDSRY